MYQSVILRLIQFEVIVPLNAPLVLTIANKRLLRFCFSFLKPTNSVYKFLSGVRVTPSTPFLLPSSTYQQQQGSSSFSHGAAASNNGDGNLRGSTGGDTAIIAEAHRFMHFAMGIYGWPMYLRQNTGMATCRLCASLRLG